MTIDEIEAALHTAFDSCNAASCPLTDAQKYILLQVVKQIHRNLNYQVSDVSNPLDELTKEELAALLRFVKVETEINHTWKAQLLNDWLLGQDSGHVQFIRNRYGLQWLNRVELCHFDKYLVKEDALKLEVGDRIEVCNGLWEWVQENLPCQPEWFPCTVIRIQEISHDDNTYTSCVIRFYNGTEYEIQGVYEWNRYNWRCIQE